MEMRIRGDRLSMERAFHVNGINKGSIGACKKQIFSTDTRSTIKAGVQRRLIQYIQTGPTYQMGSLVCHLHRDHASRRRRRKGKSQI
jgi:hypothetical protein